MKEAVAIIDRMGAETLKQERIQPVPPMGGAYQAPFDGETVGSFIRYAILHEVRAEMTGEELDRQALIEKFNKESKLS
jgi:hypothetical protein